jgi:hypothetical protein
MLSGGDVRDDLVTDLLPVLGRSLDIGFNVFDVMHHGVHEKQMSNVFRWLLDVEGSHGFGERFVNVFIAAINSDAKTTEPVPAGAFVARQEVNTMPAAEGADIADIVLESSGVSIVVENYITSDGHGHDYYRYLAYATNRRPRGLVVLLCRDEDASLQTLGWQDAVVLTYETLVTSLREVLEPDGAYRKNHSEAYSFIDQMFRKFVTRKGPVADDSVLDFITAMCVSGEARRYQEAKQDAAAERFASDLALQARERFGEGREVLQRVKKLLKNFSSGPLTSQLSETLGEGVVGKVDANYAGIYQWTINFHGSELEGAFGEAGLQVKFGPSAWFANDSDTQWKHKVAADEVDYSRLFITRAGASILRQSQVTIQEVLNGLEPSDRRLHDEIVDLLGADA